KLTRLWMDHMQMTGEIPPFLNRLTALTDLQLDNNNLTGCIPNELKFLCTNNANVDISNNQLNNNDFSTFCTNDIGNCGSMNPTCHPSLTLSASRNNDSTFAASTTITSTDTLNNPHTFVYKAGQAIQLLAGFQVQVGATFSAIIEDCSSTLQETELPINAFIQPAIATDVVEDLSLKVYPNPFYHLTTIQFTMKHQSPIQLNLYNLNGQTVKTMIHSSNYAAGIHQLNLDRQDLPKGIYLLSLQTATEQLTQKISIL
ncbi:MAG: 3-coathanger stack domain-containing protein, partial [Bacteroidota bacterium]